ncbi:MAG: glycosyltransferase family 32 protein [Chlamydiia bacterium]
MRGRFLGLLVVVGISLFGDYDLKELKILYENRSPRDGFVATDFTRSLGHGSYENGLYRKQHSCLIPTIERNYYKFCRAVHRKRGSYSVIPKKFHFIWLGSPMNELRYLIIDSWKKFHPDWEFCIWTDSSLSDFKWSDDRLRQLFEEAETWAEKADILRAVLLFQFGGVYSDLDMICLKNFNQLVDLGIHFFAGIESQPDNAYPTAISNALIGSKKGDPIIGNLLNNIIKNNDLDKNLGIHIRTATYPLSQALLDYYETDPLLKNVLILPTTYFYPHYFRYARYATEFIPFIHKETMVVHLYEGSWKIEKYAIE